MVKLTTVRKMCESINYSHLLKTVFEKCVESVKPKSLLSAEKIELILPNAIRINDEFIGLYTIEVAIIMSLFSAPFCRNQKPKVPPSRIR